MVFVLLFVLSPHNIIGFQEFCVKSWTGIGVFHSFKNSLYLQLLTMQMMAALQETSL